MQGVEAVLQVDRPEAAAPPPVAAGACPARRSPYRNYWAAIFEGVLLIMSTIFAAGTVVKEIDPITSIAVGVPAMVIGAFGAATREFLAAEAENVEGWIADPFRVALVTACWYAAGAAVTLAAGVFVRTYPVRYIVVGVAGTVTLVACGWIESSRRARARARAHGAAPGPAHGVGISALKLVLGGLTVVVVTVCITKLSEIITKSVVM